MPESFAASSLSFERTQLEGDHVMVIRLQVGTLQFAWLADMLDPELSVTMEFWRKARGVPIVLGIERGEQWDYRFFLPEMPESKSLHDGLSQRMGDVQSKILWQNIVIAAAGRPSQSSPRVRCPPGGCHPTRGRSRWAAMYRRLSLHPVT
jgi:hypothetical protein